ncbi:hypothetical protein ES703_105832 [subsurface metagenome]
MSNPTGKSFAYTAELYLGMLKAASSGVIPFSLAPGEIRNISFPIAMPSAEGAYPVYLDVFVAGELIGAYQAVEDVVVVAPALPFSYTNLSCGLVIAPPELAGSGWRAPAFSCRITNNGPIRQTRTIRVIYDYPGRSEPGLLESFVLTLEAGGSFEYIYENWPYPPTYGEAKHLFRSTVAEIYYWVEDDAGGLSATCHAYRE